MIKIKCLVLAISAVFAVNAMAQTEKTGFYIGADVGDSHQMAKSKDSSLNGQNQPWMNEKFHNDRFMGDAKVGYDWGNGVRTDLSITKYANIHDDVTMNTASPYGTSSFLEDTPVHIAKANADQRANSSDPMADLTTSISKQQIARKAIKVSAAKAEKRIIAADRDILDAKTDWSIANSEGNNAAEAGAMLKAEVARIKREKAMNDKANDNRQLGFADADLAASKALLEGLIEKEPGYTPIPKIANSIVEQKKARAAIKARRAEAEKRIISADKDIFDAKTAWGEDNAKNDGAAMAGEIIKAKLARIQREKAMKDKADADRDLGFANSGIAASKALLSGLKEKDPSYNPLLDIVDSIPKQEKKRAAINSKRIAASNHLVSALQSLANANVALAKAKAEGNNVKMAGAMIDAKIAQTKLDQAMKDRADAKSKLVIADAGINASQELLNKLIKQGIVSPQDEHFFMDQLSQSVHYKVDSETVMANAYYDFHNDSRFTPYIMVGFGVSHNKLKANGAYDGLTASGSHSKSSFAWQAGVGTSYAFTDNVYGDLGVKYTDRGTITFDQTMDVFRDGRATGDTVDGHHKVALTSIDTTIGIRYMF